jgi:membrane protease YdiL (CAAX protease family)
MGPEALWQNIQGQLLFLIVAAAGASLLPGHTWVERIGLGPGRIGVARALLVMVGFLALSNATHGLVQRLGLLEGTSLAEIDRVAQAQSPLNPLLLWFAFALAPTLGEELLFRGFLLRLLARRWSGMVAVLGSAVVFGVAHLDLVHGVAATILGAYLGSVALRAGSLRPTLLCHLANNSLALSGSVGLLPEVGSTGALPQVLAGLALAGGCLALGLRGTCLQLAAPPADVGSIPRGENEDDSSGPDRR